MISATAAETTVQFARIREDTDHVDRTAARRGRFVFLDICRAVAAPLVWYDHTVQFWAGKGLSSPVVALIDKLVRVPLHLEQNFGNFGVVLFFLVSGFVVTHRATKEGVGEFALKRVLRIYPPLLVVLVFAIIFATWLLGPGQAAKINPLSVLTNALLVNYLIVPEVVFIGVAWTLIIEVLFYLLLLVLLPVLRRWLWLALVIELALCWFSIEFARDFGGNFFLLAVSVSSIPALLIGQICWGLYSGRLPVWSAALFGVIAWTLYAWVDSRNMGRPDHGYGVALALGLLLFVFGLLVESRLRPNVVVSFLADRSYSIYLWHGVMAFLVMNWLYPTVPPPVAIVAGVLATMAVVEFSYRFVERPSQRFARWLTRKRKSTS